MNEHLAETSKNKDYQEFIRCFLMNVEILKVLDVLKLGLVSSSSYFFHLFLGSADGPIKAVLTRSVGINLLSCFPTMFF